MFALQFEPSKTPQPSRDWCNREGAYALKAQIEAYWRERGHDVMVWIEEKPYAVALRGTHFVVRSNIGKNGLPSPAQIARAA